jgi:FlaA1/EpsC-like NDP-sugar epimerase
MPARSGSVTAITGAGCRVCRLIVGRAQRATLDTGLSEADDWALAAFVRGRRVFVSGVCKAFGRALLERLRAFDVAAVVGTGHNAGGLFELGHAIDDERVSLLLGAVQDRQQRAERFRGADIVFHGAAFKHVGTCERSPRDAVSVNVVGIQNVIDAAGAGDAERVLFMSSDEAANPTSVMGASQLLSTCRPASPQRASAEAMRAASIVAVRCGFCGRSPALASANPCLQGRPRALTAPVAGCAGLV